MKGDRNVGLDELGPVLVTGGTGFIGSHLCRRLMAAGWEVHVTSRRADSGEPDGATRWQADMASASDASRVFRAVRPRAVVHLAGAVGASPNVELVLPTYHGLLTSTVNLLLAAQEVGCRRIVLSGSFTEPLPGSAHPTPGSPYAAAKWASSAYGRMFHALYGTPVVVLRPFMTYGPAQHPTKLIPTVIAALMRGEAPKLSSGRTTADWVYISDIVEAFVLALKAPGIDGMTLDLGTGLLTSVRAVVEELVAGVGVDVDPAFGGLPDRPAENEVAAVTGPTVSHLGWQATTSLQDGLRQTVEWHRGRMHETRAH